MDVYDKNDDVVGIISDLVLDTEANDVFYALMTPAHCLLPGLDRHAPQVPFAAALGHHLGIIAEREVDDAALVGRHRLQFDGTAATGDLARDPLGQADQRLLAATLVALDVHRD